MLSVFARTIAEDGDSSLPHLCVCVDCRLRGSVVQQTFVAFEHDQRGDVAACARCRAEAFLVLISPLSANPGQELERFVSSPLQLAQFAGVAVRELAAQMNFLAPVPAQYRLGSIGVLQADQHPQFLAPFRSCSQLHGEPSQLFGVAMKGFVKLVQHDQHLVARFFELAPEVVCVAHVETILKQRVGVVVSRVAGQEPDVPLCACSIGAVQPPLCRLFHVVRLAAVGRRPHNKQTRGRAVQACGDCLGEVGPVDQVVLAQVEEGRHGLLQSVGQLRRGCGSLHVLQRRHAPSGRCAQPTQRAQRRVGGFPPAIGRSRRRHAGRLLRDVRAAAGSRKTVASAAAQRAEHRQCGLHAREQSCLWPNCSR